MAARAREAQPIWASIGFEGRAEVLLAARDWMVANAERVVTTIVGETGRPADETQFAELAYGVSALEFWAKMAPRYLADEEVQSASPFVRGRKLVVRYAPLGLVGVIGPWNYPAQQLVRRLHPGARGGQRRGHEALRGDAADLAADGPDAGRVRHPGGDLPGGDRPR